MKVLTTITQKTDGLNYSGSLKIGERKFDWEIKFGAPIPKILSQEVPVPDKEAVRKLFDVALEVDGNRVEITDDLFVFLMGTVVTLALDFYQEPQTRDFNDGPIQVLINQYSPKTAATCGMERNYNIQDDDIPKSLTE